MTRPGFAVTSRAELPSRGAPANTGVAFFGGTALKGPTARAVRLTSLAAFTRHFGARQAWSVLYDAAHAFFREGGAVLWVARTVGPAATFASLALSDGAGVPATSLTVTPVGQGPSALTVEVAAGTANAAARVIIIRENGVELSRSPEFTTREEFVEWGNASVDVRIALGASTLLPAVVAATAIPGGADDRAAITDTERIATLARFLRTYGPGQVAYPGATTSAMHAALGGHASANNRLAVLDTPQTSASATLVALADADRAAMATVDEEASFLVGTFVTIPGVLRGTTRTVPPSGSVAGLFARNDGEGDGPGVPSAGSQNGVLRYALGTAQEEFPDTTRGDLTTAGVNTIRTRDGEVIVYGARTLAGPSSAWQAVTHARTRMAITADAEAIAEKFLFEQLDGRGLKIAEFHGALFGMLADYWERGALFGATAAEAFRVDTGSTVNTPQSLSQNILAAVLSVRMSPFAEFVAIEIVKVPITESLV